MTATPLTSSVGFPSQGLPGQPLINPANPLQSMNRSLMPAATTNITPTSNQQQMLNVLQNNERFRLVFEKATPEQKQVCIS